MSFKSSLLQSRWLVPVIAVLLLTAAIVALLKFAAMAGEHLAPLKPRVLIFGATWCPYCPTDAAVDKLIADFPGLDIQHIDVDKDRALALKYHIKQLPTIIICDIKQGCKVFFSLIAARDWLERTESGADTLLPSDGASDTVHEGQLYAP